MDIKAVLLLNMGGPNHLDDVPLFLYNMFCDKNILTISNPILRSIVARCIVALRVKESTRNYSLIGGKSPIVAHTKRLVEALSKQDSKTHFDFAMSYTPPFIHDIIARFKTANLDELTLFSLYPHYSTTTTLTSLELVQKACNACAYYPKIHTIDRYYNDAYYNDAIVARIQESLAAHSMDSQKVVLLFSAHGLPEKVVQKGDPYVEEILQNIAILGEKLEAEGIRFKKIMHAFQSHIGPVRWTKPFISEVLDELSGESVLVYPIAFSIDNSETDYELSIQYRQYAKEKNIKAYEVCACLNDSPLFVRAILNLIHS